MILCTHNLESCGKSEWFQKENHPPEHQLLGFSFSSAWEPAPASPLFPLTLCTELLQILPS